MTVDDLTTRLLAAIDAKTAKARAAGGEPWTTTGPGTIAEWSIYDTQWMVASATAYDHDQPMSNKPGARGPGYIDPNANSIHIADNDPADVLRRCVADRKIVELCKDMLWEHEGGPDVVAKGTLLLLAEGYGITEETA